MSQKERSQLLRKIPKVDELLATQEVKELLTIHPSEVVREGIRNGLERLRQHILSAEKTEDITEETFVLSRLLPLFKEEITKQVSPPEEGNQRHRRGDPHQSGALPPQ